MIQQGANHTVISVKGVTIAVNGMVTPFDSKTGLVNISVRPDQINPATVILLVITSVRIRSVGAIGAPDVTASSVGLKFEVHSPVLIALTRYE